MESPDVECVDLKNDSTTDTTEIKNVLLLNNENFSDMYCGEDSDRNLEVTNLPNTAEGLCNVVEQPNAENPVSSGSEQEIHKENVVIKSEIMDDQFMGEDSLVNNFVGDDDNISLRLVEDSENDDELFDSDSELEENQKFIDYMYELKHEARPYSVGFKTAATVCNEVEELKHDDPLAFGLCLCCSEPIDSAHQTGSFKCDDCEKLFVLQSSLSRHRSMEHSEDGSWCCVECNNVYVQRELLIEHMRTHFFSKVYVCCQCGHEFSRHNSQAGCDRNSQTAFECEVCNKKYTRKGSLREHLRAHTGERRSFPCVYCKKEFTSKSMRTIHYRTHTGEKPFPCDICPKRFTASGALRKHRRKHTGERPYKCTKCSRQFGARETLNRHVRTHTGDKPHECRFCEKTFIQETQLRAHLFHHTGEPAYTCPICSRAFNRRIRLNEHVKFVHEGAKPLQCDQCDRTFTRNEDLRYHNHLHSGLKPHQCEVCRKTFAMKQSLTVHMLTHRKEQPCSCNKCGHAFIRQDCLKRHMRLKHRDVLEDMASAERSSFRMEIKQKLVNVMEKDLSD